MVITMGKYPSGKPIEWEATPCEELDMIRCVINRPLYGVASALKKFKSFEDLIKDIESFIIPTLNLKEQERIANCRYNNLDVEGIRWIDNVVNELSCEQMAVVWEARKVYYFDNILLSNLWQTESEQFLIATLKEETPSARRVTQPKRLKDLDDFDVVAIFPVIYMQKE